MASIRGSYWRVQGIASTSHETCRRNVKQTHATLPLQDNKTRKYHCNSHAADLRKLALSSPPLIASWLRARLADMFACGGRREDMTARKIAAFEQRWTGRGKDVILDKSTGVRDYMDQS